MDAFKCARQRKGIVDLPTTSFSRGQAQDRPQTFAAGKQTVAHSPVQRRGLPVRFWQITVQRRVDQLLAAEEILFDIHTEKTATELLDCCYSINQAGAECPAASELNVFPGQPQFGNPP